MAIGVTDVSDSNRRGLMVRSLYSAVSGLNTHMNEMDVIGNNIANVNTINIGSKDGGGANSVLKLDNVGNVSITCDTEIKLETGLSSLIMDQAGNITLKGVKVIMESTERFDISSMDTSFKAYNSTEIGGGLLTKVTGMTLSLIGSMFAEIKSVIVKINS